MEPAYILPLYGPAHRSPVILTSFPMRLSGSDVTFEVPFTSSGATGFAVGDIDSNGCPVDISVVVTSLAETVAGVVERVVQPKHDVKLTLASCVILRLANGINNPQLSWIVLIVVVVSLMSSGKAI